VKQLKSRLPAVSGIFYPSNPFELRKTIEQSFLDRKFGPGTITTSYQGRRIFGLVSPHAGYAYSGSVAANGFCQISNMEFETIIVTGPNHYGIGSGVATMRGISWETPMGKVELNDEFIDRISKDSIIDVDDFSHSRDHCLEVQLPFLQYMKNSSFNIVPIILMLQDIETAREVGRLISRTMKTENTKGLIIASSDFTHYEPNAEAHRKDLELINAISSLDVTSFYETLARLDISACGYGAIASVMIAAKELGATRGELLRYATSGDVTGDMSSVVGYASIIFI
jgi:AmmeMemoRadiSam system protein B